MIKFFMGLLNIIISVTLFPIVNWLVEIENTTPYCCDKRAEFRGHQISLFQETLHFQCTACKKTFVVHNPHEGISLRHLWLLIFSPKSGVVKE